MRRRRLHTTMASHFARHTSLHCDCVGASILGTQPVWNLNPGRTRYILISVHPAPAGCRQSHTWAGLSVLPITARSAVEADVGLCLRALRHNRPPLPLAHTYTIVSSLAVSKGQRGGVVAVTGSNSTGAAEVRIPRAGRPGNRATRHETDTPEPAGVEVYAGAGPQQLLAERGFDPRTFGL